MISNDKYPQYKLLFISEEEAHDEHTIEAKIFEVIGV